MIAVVWLEELLKELPPAGAQRPHPRFAADVAVWRRLLGHLSEGHGTLLSLWGEPAAVHMALESEGYIAVVTLAEQRFPSVARAHPPALRLERAMIDLYGVEPQNGPDRRRWLDHGRWGFRHPLGDYYEAPTMGDAYAFHPAEGPPLHQIPVGPVHAGIIEPGHFRFHCNGETVVRLEERLGYVHKGIDGLMPGAPLERAARLAGRTSGDSTVAYALAFARAVEAALGTEAPPRAVWLRALMAELERLANHFGDIGAICNDASFSLLHTHCHILRERVLRASDASFGHRLMMDKVVPGGVAADLDRGGEGQVRGLIANIRRRFPELVKLYDNTASLQNRTVGTGILKPELALQYGAGGYVGRASGRAFDARKTPGYAPYTSLSFDVPVRTQGDVDARVWVRIGEVEQSVLMLEQIVEQLPGGAVRADLPLAGIPEGGAEGLALAEAFRGDVLAWVRLRPDGTVDRCHLRDASWFQWPLLEAAIEGNIVADFPLCNKSFNCSYSGHDL